MRNAKLEEIATQINNLATCWPNRRSPHSPPQRIYGLSVVQDVAIWKIMLNSELSFHIDRLRSWSTRIC